MSHWVNTNVILQYIDKFSSVRVYTILHPHNQDIEYLLHQTFIKRVCYQNFGKKMLYQWIFDFHF